MDVHLHCCAAPLSRLKGLLCCAEHSGSGPKHYAEDQYGLPFSLAQLVVFSLVARSGSCRAAASTLSMSQPGVSKSLASLEKVWRSMTSTQAGDAAPPSLAACQLRL